MSKGAKNYGAAYQSINLTLSQVLSAPHLIPGHHATVLFEVFNHGPARQFIVTAEDDSGFLLHGKHHR